MVALSSLLPSLVFLCDDNLVRRKHQHRKSNEARKVSDSPNPRIGLLGVGLDTYWNQFAGLEARLNGYLQIVQERLHGPGRDIINFGLVDSPERAFEVGHQARIQDIDLLVIYVTTYALSSTVLPVVRRAKVPVLVLNLQPTPALDYETFNSLPDRTAMTGEWLAYCSACPMPEIANVFARCGIPFHQVNGSVGEDEACWREIDEWMDAARVANILSHTRLGLMGHYYSGMLDIATGSRRSLQYLRSSHRTARSGRTQPPEDRTGVTAKSSNRPRSFVKPSTYSRTALPSNLSALQRPLPLLSIWRPNIHSAHWPTTTKAPDRKLTKTP